MSRFKGTRPAGRAEQIERIHRGVQRPVKPFMPECPQMCPLMRDPPTHQIGYDPLSIQQEYRRYGLRRR